MHHALIRHVTDPRYALAVRRANEARAAAIHEALRRLGAALARPLRRLAAWRRGRRNLALLAGLSDAQLEDIGLTRAQIGPVVGRLARLPPDVEVTVASLRPGPPPRPRRPRAPVAAPARSRRRAA